LIRETRVGGPLSRSSPMGPSPHCRVLEKFHPFLLNRCNFRENPEPPPRIASLQPSPAASGIELIIFFIGSILDAGPCSLTSLPKYPRRPQPNPPQWQNRQNPAPRRRTGATWGTTAGPTTSTTFFLLATFQGRGDPSPSTRSPISTGSSG
jgi:hypothetical protein